MINTNILSIILHPSLEVTTALKLVCIIAVFLNFMCIYT